ncbi:hypothetical protein [Candidatus Epulonipiscium viviparus]|uniref:hypothetical protein n=1 Tax=Candidatus Epulonipiscium viviparus TaxID=420336 RepID=UPI0027380997|nr:hypothetical protein [Candidatus Epulopiscium viviparus]
MTLAALPASEVAAPAFAIDMSYASEVAALAFVIDMSYASKVAALEIATAVSVLSPILHGKNCYIGGGDIGASKVAIFCIKASFASLNGLDFGYAP